MPEIHITEPLLIAKGNVELYLLPAMANLHGLVTGATGTGETVTLQVMAESFSRIGVPVFAADAGIRDLLMLGYVIYLGVVVYGFYRRSVAGELPSANSGTQLPANFAAFCCGGFFLLASEVNESR